MKDNAILKINIKDFSLKNTLECGQCFRWKQIEDNTYVGVIRDRVIKISQEEDYIYIDSNNKHNLQDIVIEYFDLNTDYGLKEKNISKIDNNIKKAVDSTKGIHFLNQDLFETIISYIISANNNIKRISKSVNEISKMCGKKIMFESNEYFLFPTPEELSKLTIENLESAKVGFRARYIENTVKKILEEDGALESIEKMNTKEARKKLMSYLGIGRKVADCILLFSLKRREVFPVDVWVKKIMEDLYLKKDSSVAEILNFAEEKFKEDSGIIQQHLFMSVRENIS